MLRLHDLQFVNAGAMMTVMLVWGPGEVWLR